MNRKKWITYAVAMAIAAVLVLSIAGFERSSRAGGTALTMQCLSDSFFVVSVLYIGCSVLVFIQEAGNFYGLQYLCHTLVRLFSPRADRGERKMTYFDYCLAKKERQAAQGKSPVKAAMLFTGVVCLALALLFTALFYKLP